VFRLTISFLALAALMGCVSSGDRTPMDREEVVSRAVELGIAYLRQGDTLRAKENVLKALEFDPKSAEAHASLALVFQQEQESALAEDHFRKAISFDSKYSAARNNFGAFLFAEGRAVEAVQQLEAAVADQFYGNRAQAFENLGVAKLSLGDRAGAGQAFDRALRLNPRQNRSLIEQGLLHFDASEFELARQLDERLNQFNNWSARRLLLCGLVASHFSQAGRAEDCQTALEQRYPTSDEAARLASQARKAR